MKEGVAKSLYDGAKIVCSDKNSLKTEFNDINRDLIDNRYLEKVI